MVIGYLYFVGAIFSPYETDTILIIDPNAVLPLAICRQSFEAITGGRPKIVQSGRGLDHIEFPTGHRCYLRPSPAFPLEKEPGRVVVLEALYHTNDQRITFCVIRL